MAAKKIVAGILLLFVVASIATLVWKERSRTRAIRAAGATAASPTGGTTVAPAGSASETASAPAGQGNSRDVPPRPSTAGSTRGDGPAPTPPPSPSSRKVVVTYFLTTTRCFSCYKIETLSESAVQTAFVGPLKEGRLVWRTINTDEPANAHYLKDYKLFTKSVIVSEVVDGREVRWKNCEKVWDLLDDPKAFEAYIVKEVKTYLGEGG